MADEEDEREQLSYEIKCTHCPGDGVVRGARPGVDWPTPCPCQARRVLTAGQLGRLIGVSGRSLEKVEQLAAKTKTAKRVLDGMHAKLPAWVGAP